jgi:uncharacterized SAM-binding protein YcdF (DUF218 family)
MLYVFSKLFWAAIQPDNLLVLLLALGVLLWCRGRRGGRTLVIAVTLGFLAIIVLPLGQWALAPLEARFSQPELPARVDGIVLLGGAVRIAATAAHGQVALSGAASRITETLVLARRFPAAKVLVTGGDPAIIPDRPSEAETTRSLLVALGLDEQRLLIEPQARNTFENALYAKRLAEPEPGAVWLLVTSAAHMPRAVGCFRTVGWAVLPYPVDYQTGAYDLDSVSLESRLSLIDFAVHEWIGLAAYRLLGRTDALFPGPLPAPGGAG